MTILCSCNSWQCCIMLWKERWRQILCLDHEIFLAYQLSKAKNSLLCKIYLLFDTPWGRFLFPGALTIGLLITYVKWKKSSHSFLTMGFYGALSAGWSATVSNPATTFCVVLSSLPHISFHVPSLVKAKISKHSVIQLSAPINYMLAWS